MRRKKCKSIEDKRLIMAALHKCFSSSKTKKRSDTFKLFNEIAGIHSQGKLIDMINSNSLEYKDALSKLADYFLNEIKTDTISFPKARYEKRKDNCNGKVRDILEIEIDSSKENVLLAAKNLEKIKKFIEDKEIIKEIVVPNKAINIVVK